MINPTHFWSIALFVLLLLFGYLLGSIPSGYLAGKWIKGIDLRNYGSGTVSGSMVWEHVARWAVVPVGQCQIAGGFAHLPHRHGFLEDRSHFSFIIRLIIRQNEVDVVAFQ